MRPYYNLYFDINYHKMNNRFAKLCYHERTKRIDNNFVKCIACGQKIVSIETPITNKTRQDFTNENKTFNQKFSRNFSNEIEDDDESGDLRVEYYADRNRVNNIIINRLVKYYSDPPKYHVTINGEKVLLTDMQIDRLLCDTNVMRMDELQFYGKSNSLFDNRS
jgi:hypothetical protein